MVSLRGVMCFKALLDIREQQGLLEGHSFPSPHSDDLAACWARTDDADSKAKVATASIRVMLVWLIFCISGAVRGNSRNETLVVVFPSGRRGVGEGML